jgi:hypothetical protein
MSLAEQLAKAIAEDDLSHLHLLPGDAKLKKARARGGKRATPAGAGTMMRGGLPGARPGFTVRHQTVGGGY